MEYKLRHAVALVILLSAACTGNKLSREKAAELIRSQITATLTLAVPNGEYNTFMDADYVNTLAQHGVIRTYKTKKRMSSLFPGTIDADMAAPTDMAKPFVVQYRSPIGNATSPALVLGNAHFREITGLREMDQAGKNAEVEFNWDWTPTAAGEKLDGVVLKRLVMSPITIQVHRFYYPAKAKCAVYDDGWRCQLVNWQTNHHLNDAM